MISAHGPAAGIGGARLARMDLSDNEVVKDAEHALSHCQSDFDFARWARNWGQLAMDRLRALEGLDEDSVSEEEHGGLETKYACLLDDFGGLNGAIETAIKAISDVLGNSTGPKTEAIQNIMATLENERIDAEAEEDE